MNEDYLWNKTGSDAEIEKLENALKTFRFQGGAPPALTAKTPAAAENRARRFFNFKFLFAFVPTAAAVLILFVVWFQLSNRSSTSDETAKTGENPVVERIEKTPNVEQPQVFPPTENQTPRPNVERNVVRTRHHVSEKRRAAKTVPRRTKNQEIVLTKEEKHAYDQLMLALSITSSKLKIVKDKIDGIEEQNARLTDEK